MIHSKPKKYNLSQYLHVRDGTVLRLNDQPVEYNPPFFEQLNHLRQGPWNRSDQLTVYQESILAHIRDQFLGFAPTTPQQINHSDFPPELAGRVLELFNQC